jgi:hypothetical protein
MAILKKEPEYKQTQKKPMSNKIKIYAVVAVVLIAIAVYYSIFLNVNQTVVNAPAVANITQSGTIFNVNSQQYLISLSGVSTGTASAYIHVSRLPIFGNPLLNVTLTLGNITKINAGTSYANMGIQLQSMSHNSITVKVSPLFTSLQIAPDSQLIKQIPSTLYNPGQSQASTSSQVTITISSGGGTTTAGSSSTTAATTTIAPKNNTALSINTTLKTNYMYSLLLNFSTLYANTTHCTPALYNTAYLKADGSVPTGPNDYTNVSAIVPYNITLTISNIGGGYYDANFTSKAISSLFNNKVAATIKVNPTTNTIASQTINGTGIFEGQSTTQIGQNYIRSQNYGSCGVYV